MGVGEGVESKRLVLVELDEEHGVLVMLEHRLGLVEEAAVFEGGDQVADGFALDADVGGDHVVAYCEHAGDYLHGAAVEERGQGRAELADIDDDARGLGGCG